jgi:DNA replication protein DnaC
LKLATVRRQAPEVLATAKVQRWTPEETLRVLIEAELAARDASNAATRLKAAAFPVLKTLDGFDVAASSIPAATFDYLANLEWIRARANLALIGPPGTGKTHTLIALGHAAVTTGMRVKYCTAAEAVENLYRALADNSVGRSIDALLRNDLLILDEIGFAPLDDTGTQLLFRLVAAAYERRSLAIASHWPFEQWGRFLPEQTTAASILDRLLHHGRSWSPAESPTGCGRPNRPAPARRRSPRAIDHRERVGTSTWPPTGTSTWPLTHSAQPVQAVGYTVQGCLASVPRLTRGWDLRRVGGAGPGAAAAPQRRSGRRHRFGFLR